MRCSIIPQSFCVVSAFFLVCTTAVFGETSTASHLSGFIQEEEALSRAIEQTPDSVSLLSRRGDLRQFLGQFAAAIADYQKMIKLDPTQDAPHWRLGIAYYFNGEFENGSRQFEKYHLYDGRDRENGVWKFLCDARSKGLDEARRLMLVYTRFDRHPFPSVYEMLEGKRSPEAVLDAAQSSEGKQNPQVLFFAKYYAGVYHAIVGETARGANLVREAVALFNQNTAGNGGPGYMWQIARLHVVEIEKNLPAAPTEKQSQVGK
jgi:lipoprotein NlpI